MSQKKEESAANDKWRELAEQEKQESLLEDKTVDDEHLLNQVNASDAKLRDQLSLLEKQVDVYKDQTARALAELENVRRRAEQDVAKARKFGVERLISEMIPIADSLVRGLEGATSDDPALKSLRHGMELTLGLLDKLLEKNGVSPIDPKTGDAFDPALHEAMSTRPDPEMKSNAVLQVLQKGYALHGRVLRAAMVIVTA